MWGARYGDVSWDLLKFESKYRIEFGRHFTRDLEHLKLADAARD